MSANRFALLALSCAALGCQPSIAPVPKAESAAYVVVLGSDTISVDQYTRVGDRIEGTIIQRVPRTVVTRYVATLNPSGTPSLLEFNTRLPDGTIPPNGARSVTVTFTGDSAITQTQRDTMVIRRVAARDAFPFIGNAFSLWAVPIAAQRASGRDSIAYAIYPAGQPSTTPLLVVRRAPNRYLMYIGGFPWDVTTDDAGRVLTADGARTTQHFVTRRQDPVDITALAAMFAERERATRAIGILSPRDTVNATVGAARLWVDYSRPSARGRTVFGATGVLNDTIWRTGANAATQFRTDVPLTVAGQTVPPGTYTLWTVAVPGRYQLIFNKQVGQWGTVYNRDQDLVRVPLQVNRLPASMDRFTIAIQPTSGNAGVIRIQWTDTELALPFTTP